MLALLFHFEDDDDDCYRFRHGVRVRSRSGSQCGGGAWVCNLFESGMGREVENVRLIMVLMEGN